MLRVGGALAEKFPLRQRKRARMLFQKHLQMGAFSSQVAKALESASLRDLTEVPRDRQKPRQQTEVQSSGPMKDEGTQFPVGSFPGVP